MKCCFQERVTVWNIHKKLLVRALWQSIVSWYTELWVKDVQNSGNFKQYFLEFQQEKKVSMLFLIETSTWGKKSNPENINLYMKVQWQDKTEEYGT